MNLSPEQESMADAAINAASKPGHVVVVHGPAGCGKTTGTKAVFGALGDAVVAITPTGRAALRLREVTGRPCVTAHRFRYMADQDEKGHVRFTKKTVAQLLDANKGKKLLLVEEASMFGRALTNDAIDAARVCGMGVMFVGDGCQLPPVEMNPNAPRFSVFDASFQCNQRVALTTVFRQALDSPVLRVATAIRESTAFAHACAHFEQFERPSCGVAAASARDSAAGIDHAVIVHSNATRLRLNHAIRYAKGIPHRDPLNTDDKLLVRRNCESAGVYNGQVVRFEWAPEHDTDEAIDKGLRAITIGGALALIHPVAVVDGNDDLPAKGMFRGNPCIKANLGGVLTAHSSQGSEFDEVYVGVQDSLLRMSEEDRIRYLYTATTRARRRVWRI